MTDHESPTAATSRAAGRLAAVLAGVVAPTTLVTALAYYFAWRREQAFAGYFGIDPALLDLSTSEYVLRSVDALFVPIALLLLAAFVALALRVLLASQIESPYTAPVLGAIGLVALLVGLALAIGTPVSSRGIPLQALGLGVGAVLLVYALARWRGAEAGRGAVAALAFVGVAVAIVSLFWATAEYADNRGLQLARRLAVNVDASPSAVVYSKVDLNIDPLGAGSGAVGACAAIEATQSRRSTFRYRYAGFTLLAQSGGRYFVTPTPRSGPWEASNGAVYVLPDDDSIRIELMRGSGYEDDTGESTFAGAARPPFTC